LGKELHILSTNTFCYGNTGVGKGLRHILVTFFQSSWFRSRKEWENRSWGRGHSKAASFSRIILHQKEWEEKDEKSGQPRPFSL